MATTPDEATDAAATDGPADVAAREAPRRSSAGPAPRGGVGPRTSRRPPLALAAAVTTCWAAVVSLAPVLAVVLLAHLVSGADAQVSQVLRVGLAGWLLAHGVELRTGTGPLGLAPLGFTVLAVWRVARAGVHTTRAIGGRRRGSPRLAVVAAVAVAVVYGLLGVIVAALTGMPGLKAPVPAAGLTLAGFGFVAALAGAMVESGTAARLARRTPIPVRDAIRTGLVAALLVLGAGAALAGTSLALSGGDASRILSAYHAGFAGQAGLTLVCVVYGPDIAIWAASYLVGPGFALGTGTVVSAARVSLGTMPALPVLAGVPAEPASGWAGLLLAAPMAAGMTAGWLLARRRLRATYAAGKAGSSGGRPGRPDVGRSDDGRPAPAPPPAVGWVPLLGAAVLAGPLSGAALAFVAWASAGPLGNGHLSEVGPRPWPLAAVAGGLVAAGAVVAAAATKMLIGVRRRSA
jgi:hypothetical protein